MTDQSEAVVIEMAENGKLLRKLEEKIAEVVVGQNYLVERILVALLADGHLLIEGVPGLAKTTVVKTLARLIDVRFQRIQFTPDLLPADLIGTLIYSPQEGIFTTRQGPIFANIILADEVNRAPAKVHSALLEAMEERQVTIGEQSHLLPEPFMVLATQNPIEQEGTYPLPEAQMDRFMLKVSITYPSRAEEQEVMRRALAAAPAEAVDPLLHREGLRRMRELAASVYVDSKIEQYILDVVTATRAPAECGFADLARFIEYGASPRASIYMLLAARALAFIRGRGYVVPQDIKDIGPDVLRHRIITTYEADAEGVTIEQIISRLFAETAVP